MGCELCYYIISFCLVLFNKNSVNNYKGGIGEVFLNFNLSYCLGLLTVSPTDRLLSKPTVKEKSQSKKRSQQEM